MKKKLMAVLLAALMLLSLAPIAAADPVPEGAVAIEAGNFNDANFRAYLMGAFPTELSGATYYIPAAEVAQITEINCASQGITDLTGIALFPALAKLNCSGNNLGTLDLSGNTKLKTVNCSNCGLTALNVSTCMPLETLDCSKNGLLNLDVTHQTALKELNCSENNMSTLDVSHNTALVELNVAGNKLISLNVTALSALTSLDCSDNVELPGLNVSGCTELKQLGCAGNKISSLELSQNTKLEKLSAGNNPFTALDLSANTKLTLIELNNSKINALDLSKNTRLTTLSLVGSALTSLNVTKCTKLVMLLLSDSKLTSLDVTKNDELITLICSGSALTSLDLAKNENLQVLAVSGTKISELNLTKCTALKQLECSDTKISSLDLSKNTALESLDCSKAALTKLDLSANVALTQLNCSNNHLMTLDLSKNTALTSAALYGQVYPRTLLGNINGTAYTFDLTKVMALADMPNVTLTDVSQVLNPTTGVISLTGSVNAIEYTYATGLGTYALGVSIPTLFDARTNVIVLNSSNPPTGSTAEVDGVPYPIVQGMILLPDGVKPKVITQYGYNTSGGDEHERYPVAMKVWFVKLINDVPTAVYDPNFDNILQYQGSSIRIKGVKGIRMITGVPSGKRDSLKSGSLSGLRLIEYGTIVAWKDTLAGNPLTMDTKLAGNYAYQYDAANKKTVLDAVFARSNGLVQYTNVLTFDSMEKCKPDLAMRSYMKLMDADGVIYMLYGGTLFRNIGYIAYQNRSVFKPGTDAYKYIWEIIHAVYGTMYDAEYQAS